MKICVLGVGYVGLTTAALFSDLGNEVHCIDINEQRIENLKNGIMPIYEPGLKEIVERNISENRLIFSTDTATAVKATEIIFICVGTPPKASGETDLSQVESAAISIAKSLNGYKIVVNKSTVPVGTGDFVRRTIEEHRVENHNFDVVSNPEFLREGSAVQDSFEPDRVVIGAPNKEVALKLLELYATLERPMHITDLYSAEIIKYASNAFLATKISFINAISHLCEQVGADVTVVAKGMGADNRIGRAFLNAGIGFGGSCFPKDVESLIHTSGSYGYEFKMLKEVMDVNRGMVPHMVKRIEELVGDVNGKTIGILGLAFKPNTDDIREAKAIDLIKELQSRGATIKAFDPQAMEHTKEIVPEVTYAHNAYEVAENADALVLATEWREFKLLDMERIRNSMKQPILLDGRNFYNPEEKTRMGFTYYGLGRGIFQPNS